MRNICVGVAVLFVGGLILIPLALFGEECALWYLGWDNGRATNAPDSATVLQHLTNDVGLCIPHDATIRECVTEQGMDGCAYFIILELNDDGATSFLASTTLLGAEWRDDHRFVKPPRARGHEGGSYKSTQVRLPDARYLNVLIEDDDTGVVVVHLEWFGT